MGLLFSDFESLSIVLSLPDPGGPWRDSTHVWAALPARPALPGAKLTESLRINMAPCDSPKLENVHSNSSRVASKLSLLGYDDRSLRQ